MTHTPEFSMYLDDFNSMITCEELEPIDFEEREMLIRSIFEDEFVLDEETW